MSVILIIEIEHLRILDFVKSPQIRDNLNTRKLPDLQYIWLICRLPNTYVCRICIHLPNTYMSPSASAEYTKPNRPISRVC